MFFNILLDDIDKTLPEFILKERAMAKFIMKSRCFQIEIDAKNLLSKSCQISGNVGQKEAPTYPALVRIKSNRFHAAFLVCQRGL